MWEKLQELCIKNNVFQFRITVKRPVRVEVLDLECTPCNVQRCSSTCLAPPCPRAKCWLQIYGFFVLSVELNGDQRSGEKFAVCILLAATHWHIPHPHHLLRPSFHPVTPTYYYSLNRQHRAAPVAHFTSGLIKPHTPFPWPTLASRCVLSLCYESDVLHLGVRTVFHTS